MTQTSMPLSLMIAAFNSETNNNSIVYGEGFTPIEGVVRAVDLNFSETDMQNIINVYGPNDIDGLTEWYMEKGIYLGPPIVLKDLKNR